MIATKVNQYLNDNFFVVLSNLKNDKSNCVADFLECIWIKDDIEAALDEELDDDNEDADGEYRSKTETIGS